MTNCFVYQTFSDSSPRSSQNWVLETESPDHFVAAMVGVDIPIDSSVLVYTGNKSAHLDIYDVYRPHPNSEMRYRWTENLIIDSLAFLMKDIKLGKMGLW